MLSSIIVTLNAVSVRGVEDMQRMLDVFGKLGALQRALEIEAQKHREAIAALEKRLAERPPIRQNEDGTITIGGETIDMDTGEVRLNDADA